MPNFDIPWSGTQITILQACSYSASALSLLGSLAIIVSHLYTRISRICRSVPHEVDEMGRAVHRLHDRFDALVFYLSISHALNDTLWIIALAMHDDSICPVISPFILFLYLASFFWTIFIATEIAYRMFWPLVIIISRFVQGSLTQALHDLEEKG